MILIQFQIRHSVYDCNFTQNNINLCVCVCHNFCINRIFNDNKIRKKWTKSCLISKSIKLVSLHIHTVHLFFIAKYRNSTISHMLYTFLNCSLKFEIIIVIDCLHKKHIIFFLINYKRHIHKFFCWITFITFTNSDNNNTLDIIKWLFWWQIF